ncbi:MAG TPA: 2'-5' RNA ligase family protein [Candidatus Paceibacterota bacterium]|nr:2'-5' RNA ligase family protein [Candidatus Paceibacterota bacterium]
MTDSEGRTTGYHLFLEPAGTLREELQEMIRTLAAAYHGPVFAPHVTLLAEIPKTDEAGLIEKSRELASQTAPFEITLEGAQIEDTYYHALYLPIESPPLAALYERARALFAMPAEDYRPHLSLLYGNYSAAEKAAVLHDVEKYQGRTFTADHVTLYETSGTPHEWRKVREFPFINAA